MSQQINLFQPIFRTERKVFSAMTIVQATGVFVVGLLLIYAYASWQVGGHDRQIAELEQQRQTAMSQLQVLSAQQRPQRSRTLESDLQRANEALAQKQRLLTIFGDRTYGGSRGFSAHFAGLARQRVDGLWLTRITVRGDGAVILEGATEAPELVPRYVARLGRENAFTGTEFGSLQLQRGEATGDPVRFSITTATEGAK